MVADTAKLAVYMAANARGNPVHFYTATNRKVHGKDWKQELINLAGALNYHGPATSIDLHVNTDGVYVQFERDASSNTCDVYYKRNAKMDYEFGAAEMDVTVIRQKELKTTGPLAYGDLYSSTGKNKIYTVVRTNVNSKKGRLNSIAWNRRNTITIP
jgi:hypothetical protein